MIIVIIVTALIVFSIISVVLALYFVLNTT